MKRLIKYISENISTETYITVGLFSAKGKEHFNEKFGFIIRPNNGRDAGMMLDIKR